MEGNRIVWNYKVERRVVRWFTVFKEIGVFRNVRHGLHEFIADVFATAFAGRKECVAEKKHGHSRFIDVTDFINTGLFYKRAGRNSTVRYVVVISISIFHFYETILSPAGRSTTPAHAKIKPRARQPPFGPRQITAYQCAEAPRQNRFSIKFKSLL